MEFTPAGGGRLTVETEGTRARILLTRPDDGRGLYKAVLLGEGGGEYPLGTLTPEEGCLRLSRRLAVSALEQAGCWPVAGGRVALAFPFTGGVWVREEHPERLTGDHVLRRVLAGRTMLLRRRSDGFTLAARFDPCDPYPVPPLFCLGRVERLADGTYVLFDFNRDGIPILVHKTPDEGDTNSVPKPRAR